jgi:pSer/pThr/pTyr-binding forkhead associated (FHA) protein
MRARLTIGDEQSPRRELTIDDWPVTVGRGRDAGIRVYDQWVSRQHCEIHYANGHLVVRDLESRNGTFVRGWRVHEAVLLPGYELTVGESTLVLDYEVSTPRAVEPRAKETQPACEESSAVW